MIGRKRKHERFQDDFGFAETGGEIVMQAFEGLPAGGRVCGQPAGNVCGSLAELEVQLLQGAGEDADLMEKAGTFAEKNVMKDAIPRSCALSRVATEKFRLERLDDGQASDMAATSGERGAKENQRLREAAKKVRRNGNLLAGRNEVTARTASDGIVESDAHYRVVAFPSGDQRVEHTFFFPRQTSYPIT